MDYHSGLFEIYYCGFKKDAIHHHTVLPALRSIFPQQIFTEGEPLDKRPLKENLTHAQACEFIAKCEEVGLIVCIFEKSDSPIEYPNVDPLLVKEIKKLPKLEQVQYSTNDQLKYLVDIAAKFGLYDGMNAIQYLIRR